jgi:putative membrane protein
MKIRHLFASTFLAVAVAPLLSQAQSTPPASTDPAVDSVTPPADPVPDPALAVPNPADQGFLDDAHASGIKEIHAAALAQERSGDEDVRELAALIEQDHRDLNAKLEAAGAHGETPMPGDPLTPADPESAPGAAAGGEAAAALAADPHMQELLSARGDAFDRAYLEMLVNMHEASIAKFDAVANGQGHGPAVKALAQEALPALRRHAAMAASLDDAIAQE